jgi:hypothetical protein
VHLLPNTILFLHLGGVCRIWSQTRTSTRLDRYVVSVLWASCWQTIRGRTALGANSVQSAVAPKPVLPHSPPQSPTVTHALTLSHPGTPQNGEKRLKGVSISYPIVLGTVAVSLGKKATEKATHSWTVYARNPNDESLGAIAKKVTFKLHHSFTDPCRDVLTPPFELQESGWGEFDLLVELHFHDDALEPPLELMHSLRLGLDVHGNPQRRPYVHEVYEEIVFWEPTVEFASRIQAAQGKAGPPSSVAQYFGRFDPAADYQLVQAGRKRLAKHFAMLKAKMASMEEEEGGPPTSATMDREASLFPQG